MKNNLPLGKWGETIAIKYLEKNGFRIIERNFRKRYGEIDIICEENNTLVFVEVKTRKNTQFGFPKEAITYRKLQSLIKSAYYYKHTHPKLPKSMRIDLISLLLSDINKVEKIELIRNITQDL